MKFPWTLVVLMLVTGTTLANNPKLYKTNTSSLSTYSEAQIKERLAQLNLPLEAVSNAQVMTRIRQYVTAGRNETQVILGRTTVYFPVFEHYLQQYNLPAELKYLPMIESGLRPTAKSGVGAAGMWQLMTITAKYNGLLVDGQVDQRLDAYASTEAAVKMLAFLHKQFGDWGLVLAAYNCGPGRVKKAMKVSGAKDYWTVKQYLPTETQKYVPAFIAAAYVAQYYSAHGLQPNLTPTTTLAQNTRVIKVNQGVSFKQIAQATGLSLSTIGKLNPAFIRSYVPAYAKGHNVVLPASATQSFRSYLESQSTKKVLASNNGKVSTSYVVAKGDNLNTIAKRFNISVEDIKQWNGLVTDQVHMNQELVLQLSRSFLLKRA